MADGTVDNLDIRVAADANRAVKSLNNLVSTLNKVNKAFSGMNTKSVSAFSSNVNKLASSMRALNGIKISTPNISGLTRQLNNLGKVDFSKISSAGKPIKELSSALNSLSGLSSVSIPKLETKNINSIINAVDKLGKIDSGSLPKVTDGLNKAATSLQTLSNLKFNDSGLNKTINSLNRLFQADFGKFNPADFSRITSSISTLGNMPDISSSVNRLVSSLSSLANAGEKTGQSASSISNLGQELRRAVGQFSSIGSINDDINMFVQSIARLASAGSKTGQTASGLSSLAKETMDFFNVMKNAPKISENTVRMTQALAQLASAGGRVNTATKTITSAFSKLSSVAGKTLNVIKSAGSGISSALQRIGNSGGGINKVQFGLSNLLKTAVGFRVGQGLLDFGKSMFALGSDITEVENVVNVAFGSMSNKAYEFAQTAKEQFGLSELSALKYSGTMMAILNSSGVDQSAAAEMSTTLAGLAGDLASFYNITQDDAWDKIMSAMAGEVEPMRRLGVSMTVANMEAYALSQGIDKSWQSMTQAEQAMLRYNYMMDATTAQTGDFARTSGTWANQIRLLQLNIQQLAATIGQGLIAAVLPAVTALNKLFAVLQKAANAVRDFFYVLTGYKPQIGGGIPKDLSDAGDSAAQLQSAGSGAANSLDGASKSAKKLKKNLSVLPFDQLNQLSDNTKSLSSGESGGFGGGAGFDSLAKSDVETPVTEWATRLRNAFLNHDWDKLGKEIAWGINKGLQFLYDAISWENVGPKITPFINAFTQTFNSLVDNIEWDLMGRTIGAGINTIVNSLNLLIEGISFKSIGEGISKALRGAISEIQWTNLGNLIGNFFMIAWRTLNGFITDMSQTDMDGLTGFERVGAAIGSVISGIFDKIKFKKIGKILATAINGIFDGIRALSLSIPWNDIATNVASGLNKMIHKIEWAKNGKILSNFVTKMLGAIKDSAGQVDWAAFGKGVGDFLGAIDWVTILSDVATIIYDAASGMISGLFDSDSGTVFKLITTFFVASKLAGIGLKLGNAMSEAMTGNSIKTNILKTVGTFFKDKVFTKIFSGISISTIASSVGTWITGTFAPAIASAFSAVAGVLFSPIGIAVVGAIIGGFLIFKNWDKITEFAGNVKDKVVGALSDAGEWLKEKGSALIDGLKSGIESAKEGLGTAVSKIGTFVKEKAGDAGEWLKDKGSDAITGLKNGYESVKNSEFLDKVATLKDETFNKIGDIKTKVTTKGKNVVEGLKNGYQSIKESQFLTTVSTIKDETFARIGGMKDKITQKGKDVINGLKNGYTQIKESEFLTTVSTIKDETFARIGGMKDKITQKGKDVINGLKNGYNSIKNSEFLSTVNNIRQEVFKKIGDIGSKVNGKGKDIINGLKEGLDDRWPNLSTSLSKIPDNIERAIGSLKYLGKSIMRGFADGISSIDIKLPHITWDWKTLGAGDLSIEIPTNFGISWYAKGGLFDDPSIIGVGEAGREAVLPLENKRTMRMIANSIIDNSDSFGGLTSDEIKQAVAQGVAMAMMNNQNNQPVTVYAELKTENDEVLARAVARGQHKLDYRFNPTPQIG